MTRRAKEGSRAGAAASGNILSHAVKGLAAALELPNVKGEGAELCGTAHAKGFQAAATGCATGAGTGQLHGSVGCVSRRSAGRSALAQKLST